MSAASAALPAPVRTPLVRDGRAWVKTEGAQHTGSVKYRMVHAKLSDALVRGAIDARTVLVEATAGSTGVALAFAAHTLGMRAELHAYTTADPKKCDAIRAHGANLVLHPPSTPIPEVFGLIDRAVASGTHWSLGQYERGTSRAYTPLADELLAQLRERDAPQLRMLVCAVGTGGVIQGVGARLRAEIAGLSVVAIEPEPGAAIDGIRNTQLQYLGESDPYDRTFPDVREVVPAPNELARIGDVSLGASASAALAVVRARGWGDALVIAAD